MTSKRKSHRIRAKMQDDLAAVKVLIRELRCEHNGETVLSADWSWGVASNPYLSFRILEASPSDRVRIQWIDSRGEEDSVETVVS